MTGSKGKESQPKEPKAKEERAEESKRKPKESRRKPKESKLKPGQKIDMLTLLRIVDSRYYEGSHHHTYLWECRCDCGNICVITEYTLLRKSHKHSCGCYQKRYLHPQGLENLVKAGRKRAEKRNKDGVNVDILFRNKPIKTNTSGVQGVSWADNCGKWHVYIGYKSKRANLGYFEDFDLAVSVRKRGLEAVKNGNFEEFYEALRGKPYGAK